SPNLTDHDASPYPATVAVPAWSFTEASKRTVVDADAELAPITMSATSAATTRKTRPRSWIQVADRRITCALSVCAPLRLRFLVLIITDLKKRSKTRSAHDLELVHLYTERGSPKYEKAAMRWSVSDTTAT